MSRKRNRQQRKNKKDTVNAVIYNQSDFQKDEKNFSMMENGRSDMDWSTFSRLMINDICTNSNILEDGYIGDYKIEDIELALKNPKIGWRILLYVSQKLMLISPHYYRLNNFFSNMALFCWWVDLYGVKDSANIDIVKKNYGTLTEKLENMNLKHEFSKIMKVLPYQDIFCGVIVENQNDFFIQKLDYNICKLYEVQDGLYNFVINLAAIKVEKIDAYPLFIKQAYVDYKDGKIGNWYKPPADLQICIKFNSQWSFPYPILIGLINDLLDLKKYKELKLQSARTDNYKAIMVEVPIDKDTVDKPLLTPDTIGVFAEINRESLNDDIGLIYNLGDKGEAISFKESSNTRNNVSDANDSIYDSAGISNELFNSSASATAVNLATENNSGMVYSVYRQFERWVNRWIKIRRYNKSNYKFKYTLLDITIFNRDTVSKRYKEAVSLGVSVIDKWLASMDMTPSVTLGSFILHKDIFDFQNNFTPLASSYNASASEIEKGEVGQGRPTNEEKGEQLTESGEQTLDSDANNNR